MGQTAIKYKRVFSTAGGDPSLPSRVTYLENNEYKITYWEEISTNTGTITKPTNSTIILDGFMQGVDALVETIVNGQPSGFSPVTGGGAYVTVSSFDTSGNYTISGTPSATPVALLYIITIKAENYQNVDNDFVLTAEPVNPIVQTITNGDTTHSPSGDAVFDALALKADLTDIRFKSDDMLIREALGSVILASTIPIDRVGSSYTLVDTRMDVVALYLREAKTLTGIKWFQQTQGNYTADNYNGIGLYSYDGAGTLTLVASSTDDGNIWKGASFTIQSKAFSASYNAAAGVYFAAFLYNNSAQVTAPAIGAGPTILNNNVPAADFTNSAKFRGNRASLSSFPATQSMTGGTGLGLINSMPYLAVY